MSTVASAMALGSLGSPLTASANHSANSANGSSAAVKSPSVNAVGCLMELVSVISEFRVAFARGSVTPIAAAYSSDGRTCRDFLASYVNGGNESWLHGAACQTAHGRWEIHTLKPWTRS